MNEKKSAVDYSALRRKFPTKDAGLRHRLAIKKSISREYEQKRAELYVGRFKAPVFHPGLRFYGFLVIGLMLLGSLVLSATGRGGKAPKSKAQIKARDSIYALAVALGRYRFHVGAYPSNDEGLAALAQTESPRSGWNGPYVKKIVPDPWGHDYYYCQNGENETPTLYSRGPDGRAGTTDDILPDAALFDLAFTDTSWTNQWVPAHLRGYVLARDEADKRAVEREVKRYLDRDPAEEVIEGSVVLALRSITADEIQVHASYRLPIVPDPITFDTTIQGGLLWELNRPVFNFVKICEVDYPFAARTLRFRPDGDFELNDRLVTTRGIRILAKTFPEAWRSERAAVRRMLVQAKAAGANAVAFESEPPDDWAALCEVVGLIAWPDAAFAQDPARWRGFAATGADLTRAADYWLVASEWNDRVETVRMLSDWTEPAAGETDVPVRLATSGDAAIFYVNGEKRAEVKRTAPFAPLETRVPYEPGELKVIAFRRGRALGETTARTALAPETMKVVSEEGRVGENQLAFLTTTVVDASGTPVASFSDEIQYAVTGPGELVATFDAGRTVVVRRHAGSGVPLVVEARAKGLRNASASIGRREGTERLPVVTTSYREEEP